ncbi:MAG: hypothetical protein HRT35_02265 [Algicola sp.]|nr:hypothetical protein [Algicola sp.]
MKMPLSEVIDRYTITKLKTERTDEDVSAELTAYENALNHADYQQSSDKIKPFIERLYHINGQIWDIEGGIRSGAKLSLQEVGRLALKVRDLNCTRSAIKSEVVDMFAEGFKEIKLNYKKIDYGRNAQPN